MIPRFVLPALLLTTAVASLAAQTGSVDVNGVTLPYVVQGSGPPLVLIHGWAVNHHYWDGDVDELARHYTVIRYDRRGFGAASGKPDATADAADLAALLEHFGYSSAHVMGHSQGAAVALTFAVRYPESVNRLVLFGPGPALTDLPLPPGEHSPPFPEWIATGNTFGVDSLRAAIAGWAMHAFGGDMPPDAMEMSGRMMEGYTGADLLDPASPSNLAPPPRVEELQSVAAPTLIIHGDQEMEFIKLTADVLTYGIPDARRVVIDGGGHIVNWQEPERFAAEILRFLRQTDGAD